MNTRDIKSAIESGKAEAQQRAQLELLTLVETLSTAVLELAGDVRLKTGKDPLMLRTRLTLADFLDLPTLSR